MPLHGKGIAKQFGRSRRSLARWCFHSGDGSPVLICRFSSKGPHRNIPAEAHGKNCKVSAWRLAAFLKPYRKAVAAPPFPLSEEQAA